MPHSNDEYPMSRKPLIGVSACTKQIGHHSFHIAGDKYLRAAAIAGVPLVIPALDELIDPATLLESFDGLLFTGSPSNVEPHHYGGPASEPAFSLGFKDAAYGFATMTAKNKQLAFMQGIQNKDIQIQGNPALVMWFQGLTKYLKPKKKK